MSKQETRGRKKDITMVEVYGDKLKEEIHKQGFQQKKLSKMIDRSPSSLSKSLSNDRISIADLIAISTALGFDYRHFMKKKDSTQEIYIDQNGDYVLDHPSNPSAWLDLMFSNPEEYKNRLDSVVEQAKEHARLTEREIMTESQILERKRNARESALKQLSDLLHTGYMYPAWKHAESAEMLSNLLEELRMYVESLPDADNRKEGK